MTKTKRGGSGETTPLGTIDPAVVRIVPTNTASTSSLQPPLKGGRRPRNKGRRLEQQLAAFLQRAGIAAERVPLSGSAGGKYSGDLSVPILGVDRVCECKCRSKGFDQLYRWLDQRELLFVRQDWCAPLVILPIGLFIEIALAAERGRR
jgi:hypothetical protein